MRPTWLAIIAIVAAALLGSASAALAQDRPGIGASTARPVGKAFEWPPGLIPMEPIQGYHANDCRRRPGERHDEERGVGLHVRLCLGLTNTTGAPIRLDLPAGLLFVALNDENQNGLTITVETFEIPPGDYPYFIALNLWCANANRSPSGFMDFYEVGPITEDRQITDLITRIANRPLSADDAGVIQDLVWSVTDGKDIDERDRQWLRGS